MTSTLTKNYWLDVFSGWVEARDMPGPQNDEALKVIKELKVIASRLRCEIHGTEIVSDPDDPNDDGHCGECVIEDMKAAQHGVQPNDAASQNSDSGSVGRVIG